MQCSQHSHCKSVCPTYSLCLGHTKVAHHILAVLVLNVLVQNCKTVLKCSDVSSTVCSTSYLFHNDIRCSRELLQLNVAVFV